MRRLWVAIGLALVVCVALALVSREPDASVDAARSDEHDAVQPGSLRGASPADLANAKTSGPALRWTRERLASVLQSDLSADADDPAMPDGRRSVQVSVVDRWGRPVRRAELRGVWAHWQTKAYHTDTNGCATLDLPLLDCAVRVLTAPEARRMGLPYRHPVLRGAPTARIVVPTRRRLSGVVRGLDGERPSDQVVAYRRPFAAAYERQDRHPWVVRAADVGADGSFSLNVPDDDDMFVMYVDRDRGFTSHSIAAMVTPQEAHLVLVAGEATAGSLRVEVQSPGSDGPLEGVQVYCRHVWSLVESLQASTSAEGVCTFDALRESLYVLRVIPGERAGRSWGGAYMLVHVDGSTSATLVLPPAGTQIRSRVRGQVQKEDGRGVPAGVSVFQDGHQIAQLGTDHNGYFDQAIPRLPGTVVDLTAQYGTSHHVWVPGDHYVGVAQRVLVGGDPIVIPVEKVNHFLFANVRPQRDQFIRFASHFVTIWADGHAKDQLLWPPAQLGDGISLWRSYITTVADCIGHTRRARVATERFLAGWNRLLANDANLMGPSFRAEFADYLEGIGYAADTSLEQVIKTHRTW